ncbi:MAG: hypothetical protein DDG60_06745 [Anaerolineae bacterium]|nr:MAG: hypothetical protein DDG60_06745 [Anaerolineae bacterium]
MTGTTANMRFFYAAVGFKTIGSNLHAAHKHGAHRAHNTWFELQMLARIGAGNAWHGTSFTQVRRPGLTRCFEQPAFFYRTPTKVITIKMGTINTRRGAHENFGVEKFEINEHCNIETKAPDRFAGAC